VKQSRATISGRSRTEARFAKKSSTASKNDWNESPSVAGATGRKVRGADPNRGGARRV
jgi:hypothetical protein